MGQRQERWRQVWTRHEARHADDWGGGLRSWCRSGQVLGSLWLLQRVGVWPLVAGVGNPCGCDETAAGNNAPCQEVPPVKFVIGHRLCAS